MKEWRKQLTQISSVVWFTIVQFPVGEDMDSHRDGCCWPRHGL